jgi:hypothetical protein
MAWEQFRVAFIANQRSITLTGHIDEDLIPMPILGVMTFALVYIDLGHIGEILLPPGYPIS